MKHQVDLRGLSCPQPVLRTKKLFDDATVDTVEAMVDDDVCVNNLQRLARSLNATAFVEEKEGFYRISIERNAESKAAISSQKDQVASSFAKSAEKSKSEKLTVIFLSRETFGEGEPEFSRHLQNLFLQTVLDAGHEPKAILLANTGVKLMAPDSPSLKVLRDFKERGCEVLACGLCVEFYGLKECIPKEQITNMYAITEYLFAADKILSP